MLPKSCSENRNVFSEFVCPQAVGSVQTAESHMDQASALASSLFNSPQSRTVVQEAKRFALGTLTSHYSLIQRKLVGHFETF